MLTGVHFLLTYTCNFECDHCFLYYSPKSKGTYTTEQVTKVLDEALKIGTVEWIFYEGGEPFLVFPLLKESIKRADERGFKTGVVTDGPAELAKQLGVTPKAGYIDECHFCFLVRKANLDRFPEYLAPKQVYGL